VTQDMGLLDTGEHGQEPRRPGKPHRLVDQSFRGARGGRPTVDPSRFQGRADRYPGH
jgi:hypothetical protein